MNVCTLTWSTFFLIICPFQGPGYAPNGTTASEKSSIHDLKGKGIANASFLRDKASDISTSSISLFPEARARGERHGTFSTSLSQPKTAKGKSKAISPSEISDTPRSGDSLFGSSPAGPSTQHDPDSNLPISPSQSKALPSHIERQANPKVKPAPIPATKTLGRISTKEKIVRSVNSAAESTTFPKNRFAMMKIPRKNTTAGSSNQVLDPPKEATSSGVSSHDSGLSVLNRNPMSIVYPPPAIFPQEHMLALPRTLPFRPISHWLVQSALSSVRNSRGNACCSLGSNCRPGR